MSALSIPDSFEAKQLFHWEVRLGKQYEYSKITERDNQAKIYNPQTSSPLDGTVVNE
jgi:hypothetical protein